MAYTLIEEVETPTDIASTSNTFTFSSEPSEGDLIVIAFTVNNAGANFQVTVPGFSNAVAQSDGTFRTLGVLYKVAGASETTVYTMTMTDSAVLTGTARVFSGALGTVNPRTVIHEPTDTNTISDSLTATVGSLVIAHAYTSSTATKSWNAGWGTPSNPYRTTGVWKESAGGSETATMTLDTGTNNRLSLALVEFTAGTSASTTLDAALVYGSAFSGSYSGFTGVPENTATISDGTGSDLSVAVTVTDNGDGTGTFTGTMPSLPAAGQNITGVSLGNVTFCLADPGA